MSTKINQAKRVYSDEGIVELLKRCGYYGQYYLRKHTEVASRPLMNRLYRHTDARKLTSPTTVYSTGYHTKRQGGTLAADAEAVVQAVNSAFAPDSVIDLGCSVGHYLKPLFLSGVDVHGVDGDKAAIAHGVIPESRLEHADLRDPYEPPQRYDVALCIEVAEHIAPEYADTLVETCCRCAPLVVFTAAPPGQGGTHHVNEQPHDYWIEKFAACGYEYDQSAVKALKDDIEVTEITHVKDNLLVFRQS